MRRQSSGQPWSPNETIRTESRLAQVLTRREEQYALLDRHRQLTAQLQALNDEFHALESELQHGSQDRLMRVLGILEEEVLVLRKARALDGDIHRLFGNGT